MSIKIGFYICHCGINIAYRVRVEEVAEYIRQKENVVIARDYKFMCSDPGQEMIEKDIKEFGLNRVVVASCTPRIHEKTFQNACLRAGINPYYFQMASVREQVSWVTEDEDQATRKAKTLAAAAVNRVNQHQFLYSREVVVNPDIMVVGGGIAGMQAALDVASSGTKVYLVERDSTVGGHMLQFDKTFPTLDCAACIGTPKMVEVVQHPNIELLSYSEVTDVSGYIGNFNVNVHRKARYVKEGICTGCGECITVCPITRKNEWDVGLANRKAIYRAFPQAVPITYLIDKKGTAPCKATCPAHVSVQGFIALMNQKKHKEALALFKKDHPFPGSCGRICHHPCESICTRGDVDEAMAIQHLHRYLSDLDLHSDDPYIPEMEEKRDEKIAVIGSGPAGLACAYFAAIKGFQVTVYEKLPVKGGMMAVGIPEYRLPREELELEIAIIEKMGVEIKTGISFGTDITLDSLKKDGYQAVFLATGLHKSRSLPLDGVDQKGVLLGVEFLQDIALGQQEKLNGKVIVIGGGNVAVDVALSAKRMGADSVAMVCLEKRDEMPAWDYEVAEAIEEKVEIINSYGPHKFLEQDGVNNGIELVYCTSVFDDEGRFNPAFDNENKQTLMAENIIIAIGQMADLDFAKKQDIPTSRAGGLEVDPVTLQSSIPWVFAGGDVVYGPKSVVEAVACGKEAVESIDRYFNGIDLHEGREKSWDYTKPELEETVPAERIVPDYLPVEERAGNFREITSTVHEDQALEEASRCLECAVCSECYQCVDVCEPKAIDHEMEAKDIQVDVGSIIIATGFDLMDPSSIKQFGYGKYPNVFTSFEFERLSNATGPTGGKILIRDENGELTKAPKKVAILHCVGSRDANYHEYCSRVCCMYALKYSHLIKEKVGHDTEVFDFYIDQRCYGKGYEEFYQRCQNEGTNFVRGKVAEITYQPAANGSNEGQLVAIAEDTLLGERLRYSVDMVILCVAMEARKDAADVGRTFGINVGSDGFFLEEHPKLAPLSTPTDGVFLAGTCQSPKDIPDTVAQASGAAVKALALSTKGVVAVPPTISYIDPNICAGCQTCIGLCAYGAIEFSELAGISVVNEALCKGCGSCSGFCPSNAASVKHFKSKQLFAEIDGLMTSIASVGL